VIQAPLKLGLAEGGTLRPQVSPTMHEKPTIYRATEQFSVEDLEEALFGDRIR